MKKNNRDGFTLAELLIVIAIIGVLVAISIPIFTSKLEKAREATDAANIRSQYAQVMTEAITDGGDVDGRAKFGAVDLKQKKDQWQNSGLKVNLEGVYGSNIVGEYPKAGGTAWVEFDGEKAILHYEGGNGSSGSESENTGGIGGDTGGSTSGSGGSSTGGGSDGGSTGGSSGDSGNAAGGSSTILTEVKSTPWPSDTNDTKNVVKGDVLSKNGSLYIETNSSDTITSYQDPETSQELGYHFAKVTGTRIGDADLVTVQGESTGWRAVGSISKYIYRGDIYVTKGGSMYVANADSFTQLPPTDNNAFWVKINQ